MTANEYRLYGESDTLGWNVQSSHQDEIGYDAAHVLSHLPPIIDGVLYMVIVSAVLFALCRAANRSTFHRTMAIRSSKAACICRMLERTTGRKATLHTQRMKGVGSAVSKPVVLMHIYRLEETTLKDAVFTIDAEADIAVASTYRVEEELRTRL